MKQPIVTTAAPGAIGPYSQGCESSNIVITSGQLPINPQTGEMPADIKGQSRQSLANVVAVLEAAGCSTANVIKTTVFLSDMGDFAAMNEEYAKVFSAPYPARSAVAVKTLPKNALVEIEAIAVK